MYPMPAAGTLSETSPLRASPWRVETLESVSVASVQPAPSRAQELAALAPGGPSHMTPSTPMPKLNPERLTHARPCMPFPLERLGQTGPGSTPDGQFSCVPANKRAGEEDLAGSQ